MELRQALDELLAELAQAAREEEGFSWAEVGKVLDITKQAAQQRFGKTELITVSADGTVKVSKSRKKVEKAIQDALAEMGNDYAGLDVEMRPIPVEVEVPVRVERRVVKKVVKKKAQKAKK